MKRLLSLDILRGITVCGMILVNNAGGPVSYAPLRHSVWNGLTPCDLVFPFFLFMVGISTYISLRKFNFEPTSEVVKKIVRRTFLIILIGLAIDWFGYVCNGDFFPIDTLRIPGVLQRIGLCYGIVSLMVIYINHKYLPWICGGLLLAYSILQETAMPVMTPICLRSLTETYLVKPIFTKRVRLTQKALPAHYLP